MLFMAELLQKSSPNVRSIDVAVSWICNMRIGYARVSTRIRPSIFRARYRSADISMRNVPAARRQFGQKWKLFSWLDLIKGPS
jgi:hypothetical protein